MDDIILIIIVIAAGFFVIGYLKKTITRGEKEDNCQDCTLQELLKSDQAKKKAPPANAK